MKRRTIAVGSAVLVASFVCLVPASAESDSTNDFSATTSITKNVDQPAEPSSVGLNNAYNNDASFMREDEEYWDRLLQTMESSLPNAPSEIRENDDCPSRVVDVQCPDCQSIGEDCVVEVDMTHTVVNSGGTVVRIYELNVIRNKEKSNLYDLIPSDAVDMQPGSQTRVVERVQIDQCKGESFETATQLIVGPPADAVVNISCQGEDGGDCQSISQPETAEECQEDVLYTYSVLNTGEVDANIITLERTRNGDNLDLLSLLDGTSLAPGLTKSLEETDNIDLCSGDKYLTRLLVRQVPNDDLLCASTATYM
jgi:hypothetical protein